MRSDNGGHGFSHAKLRCKALLRSLAWCRFLVLAQIETEQIEASGVPLCTNASTASDVNICVVDQSLPTDSRIGRRFLSGHAWSI
jgi:hypothetical protein